MKGPRHRNPPDSPYKAGEWISGSHLHLYREGLDDRVAYELEDAPEWENGQIEDGIVALERVLATLHRHGMAAYSDRPLMNKKECQRLIDEYLIWLKREIKLEEIEGTCLISTPFLDRHNDAIEIYLERENGALRLTDDGSTIRDLRSTGLEFTTPKRKAHLLSVLSGFGIKQQGDELFVDTSPEDFPQKKHNLVQALLAVNDMFVMAEEHVLSLFKEDVALFLESYNIHAFSDFKLTGKSGFDHKFDFGLPKTTRRPQRVLQSINILTKDNATSLAFALADIRSIRPDPLGAFTMINDSTRSPNDEHLAALRAYEVEPLLWTRREEFSSLLNGSN